MSISNLFDPSTISGALLLGISSSLIVGIIMGFFAGKTYEKKKHAKAVINGSGNNTVIQNSNIGK